MTKEEDIRNWLINKMVEEIKNRKKGEYNLCHIRTAAKFNIDVISFQKIINGLIFDSSVWDEIRNKPECAMTKFSFSFSGHGCKNPNFNEYKSKVDSDIIKDDFSWMGPEDREKYLREKFNWWRLIAKVKSDKLAKQIKALEKLGEEYNMKNDRLDRLRLKEVRNY
jgi:hypothetical protein